MKFPDLKPGDQVILPGDYGSRGVVATVERVTKTQFTAGGARWTRSDGAQVGSSRDSWHSHYAWPATPERIAACDSDLRLRKAFTRCSRHLNRLSTATREQHREATAVSDMLQVAARLEQVALHLEQAIQALAPTDAVEVQP